jgi:hypothetical protein
MVSAGKGGMMEWKNWNDGIVERNYQYKDL